jgi:hypothetical protein
MFTREEASRIRHEFWTAFGKYMSPILSTEGTKVNWINYHTRVKDVYFRMEAGQKRATIAISVEHTDLEIQQLYFEQFLAFKTLLHLTLGEEWEWQLHHRDENGRISSRILKEINNVSVLNKDRWPELISFFKPRMIALDSFWENARHSFEGLR